MNNPITGTLPWSREAEQSVLGAMLIDPSAYDRAGVLRPQHFLDPAHAVIFNAIERLEAKHDPVDAVTVYEVLRGETDDDQFGGLPYLGQLAQVVASTRAVARHADIVREKAADRSLLEAAEKAVEIASKPGGDFGGKVDLITSIFCGLQRSQLQSIPQSLADVALKRTGHYEALAKGIVERGWSTGFTKLDELLNGGLKPGKFIVLAARPGVGKSSFAQFMAMTLANAAMRILFLSQEMSVEELADRAVSSAGRINYSALQNGRMNQADWGRASELLELPLLRGVFVDDQPGLTLMDIRAKAKQVLGLNVLIVDYLQLCAGSSNREANRNAEVEQISRGLKILAKEMGITVIALSQLNRGVETRADKRPLLSDLRDSGAIEQDADVIGFLRQVREHADGSRLIGLELPKNRQGRRGELALHFDGSQQRWEESTESLAQPATTATRGSSFNG